MSGYRWKKDFTQNATWLRWCVGCLRVSTKPHKLGVSSPLHQPTRVAPSHCTVGVQLQEGKQFDFTSLSVSTRIGVLGATLVALGKLSVHADAFT